MELAQALLLLWRRRLWVVLGLVVALGIGGATVKLLKKKVYAEASTELIVESPKSPLGNVGVGLNPFASRANVFANLMATHPAVVEIARVAGIPADQIVATGPAPSTGGAPVSSGTPGGQNPGSYKLFLDQDPTLPTVDVYAQAPTTAQAVRLANAAVTGFADYLHTIEAGSSVGPNQRVEIHQLGGAIGAVVDPGASKKIAAVLVLIVLLAWCAVILLVERARAGRAQPMPAGGEEPALILGDELLYGLDDLNGYAENPPTSRPERVTHRDRDRARAGFSHDIATPAQRSPARDGR